MNARNFLHSRKPAVCNDLWIVHLAVGLYGTDQTSTANVHCGGLSVRGKCYNVKLSTMPIETFNTAASLSTGESRNMKISVGMHVEGRCQNTECIAYGTSVLSPQGVKFSAEGGQRELSVGFQMDDVLREASCPVCKATFGSEEVTKIAFYRSEYSYVKYNDLIRRYIYLRGIADDPCHLAYCGTGFQDWQSLILSVKPI